MPDELLSELLARQTKQLGGPSATIGPKPEPSMPRKVLEFFTGYPADDEREMTPLDGINMLLTAGGAAKGGKWLYDKAVGGPAAKAGEIASDLYGLNPAQTRRQFLDRASGGANRRLLKDAGGAFTPEDKKAMQLSDSFVNPETGQMGASPSDVSKDEWTAIKSALDKEQGRYRFFDKYEKQVRADPFRGAELEDIRQLLPQKNTPNIDIANANADRVFKKLFPPPDDLGPVGTSVIGDLVDSVKRGSNRFKKPSSPQLPWEFP